MRITKIKSLILATLLGVALGIAGCSATKQQEQPTEESGAPASHKIEKGISIPEKEEGSDDMERLD